jgi:hypothetical protein
MLWVSDGYHKGQLPIYAQVIPLLTYLKNMELAALPFQLRQLSASAFTRRRTDGLAIDELRLGEALPAIVLVSSHIVRPAHDPSYPRATIPLDVGDRGPAPIEIRVAIDADQRDVTRHPQAPVGEVMVGGVVENRLVQDQGSGRSEPTEQRLEAPL